MNLEKTNLIKHCELCSNHNVSFNKGIFCILTNEKPNFDKNELDSILELYNMSYEIDIKIKDRILKPT